MINEFTELMKFDIKLPCTHTEKLFTSKTQFLHASMFEQANTSNA